MLSKLDLFNVSGVVALRQLIKVQYDVDIDFTAVRVDKRVQVLNAGNPNESRLALVKLSAKEGTGYVGLTSVQYRTISTLAAGIAEMEFVLPITSLPVTVGKLVDAMEVKYGAVIDVADFGETEATVLATAYGPKTLMSADSSLRFDGPWQFVFTDVDGVDLRGLVAETAAADMADVVEVNQIV